MTNTCYRDVFQESIHNNNFKISAEISMSMEFRGLFPLSCKLLTTSQVTERVNILQFINEMDVDSKIERFNRMCATISWALKNKVGKDII